MNFLSKGLVGILVLSPSQCAVPVRECLFPIRCACSRYAVPVPDTLCLFVIRFACCRYAVPVPITVDWLFVVPVAYKLNFESRAAAKDMRVFACVQL